jgi:hypothetical protein
MRGRGCSAGGASSVVRAALPRAFLGEAMQGTVLYNNYERGRGCEHVCVWVDEAISCFISRRAGVVTRGETLEASVAIASSWRRRSRRSRLGRHWALPSVASPRAVAISVSSPMPEAE